MVQSFNGVVVCDGWALPSFFALGLGNKPLDIFKFPQTIFRFPYSYCILSELTDMVEITDRGLLVLPKSEIWRRGLFMQAFYVSDVERSVAADDVLKNCA